MSEIGDVERERARLRGKWRFRSCPKPPYFAGSDWPEDIVQTNVRLLEHELGLSPDGESGDLAKARTSPSAFARLVVDDGDRIWPSSSELAKQIDDWVDRPSKPQSVLKACWLDAALERGRALMVVDGVERVEDVVMVPNDKATAATRLQCDEFNRRSVGVDYGFRHSHVVVAPDARFPKSGDLTIADRWFAYSDIVDGEIAVSKDSPEDRQKQLAWIHETIARSPAKTVQIINSRFESEDAGPIEPLTFTETRSDWFEWLKPILDEGKSIFANFGLDPKYFAPKETPMNNDLNTATGADLDRIAAQFNVTRLRVDDHVLSDADFRRQLRREMGNPWRTEPFADDLLDVLEIMREKNVIVITDGSHFASTIERENGCRSTTKNHAKIGVVRRFNVLDANADIQALRSYHFDAVVDCRASGLGGLPESVASRLTPRYTSVAWCNGKWDVKHVRMVVPDDKPKESALSKVLTLASGMLAKASGRAPVNPRIVEMEPPGAKRMLVRIDHDDDLLKCLGPTEVFVSIDSLVREGVDPMVALKEFAAKNPVNVLGDETPVDHGKRFAMSIDETRADTLKAEVERTYSEIKSCLTRLLRENPGATARDVESHLINLVTSNGEHVRSVRVHSPDGVGNVVEVECAVQGSIHRVDFAVSLPAYVEPMQVPEKPEPTEGQRLADFFARSEHDGQGAVKYQKPKGVGLPDWKSVEVKLGTQCYAIIPVEMVHGVGLKVQLAEKCPGGYTSLFLIGRDGVSRSWGDRIDSEFRLLADHSIPQVLRPFVIEAQGALRHYEKENAR